VVDEVPFARRHGVANYTRYYQPRLIEVDAVMTAAAVADVWGSIDGLKAAMALGTDHLLAFQRSGLSYDERCYVRVADAFTADVDYSTPNVVTWSVILVASDPRVYARLQSSVVAAPPTSGASLAFTVGGTYETSPVWALRGPANTGTVIALSGGLGSFTIVNPVLAGQELVIDVYARTVKLNGDDARQYLDVSSTWFDLSPGSYTVTVTGTGFTGATLFLGTWNNARI
jgi:hypothetical protein